MPYKISTFFYQQERINKYEPLQGWSNPYTEQKHIPLRTKPKTPNNSGEHTSQHPTKESKTQEQL